MVDTQQATDSYQLIQSGISAAAALLGVFVGGWLTGYHERKRRQKEWKQKQLMELYGPLHAMRTDVRAKNELRVALHGKTNAAWMSRIAEIVDPNAKQAVSKELAQRYEKVWAYSDDQIKNDVIPAYSRMLDLFKRNMGLAEPSTLEHYGDLLGYVEVWKRWLSGSLPAEVAEQVDNAEKKLDGFFEDVDRQFRRLSGALKN